MASDSEDARVEVSITDVSNKIKSQLDLYTFISERKLC